MRAWLRRAVQHQVIASSTYTAGEARSGRARTGLPPACTHATEPTATVPAHAAAAAAHSVRTVSTDDERSLSRAADSQRKYMCTADAPRAIRPAMSRRGVPVK